MGTNQKTISAQVSNLGTFSLILSAVSPLALVFLIVQRHAGWHLVSWARTFVAAACLLAILGGIALGYTARKGNDDGPHGRRSRWPATAGLVLSSIELVLACLLAAWPSADFSTTRAE